MSTIAGSQPCIGPTSEAAFFPRRLDLLRGTAYYGLTGIVLHVRLGNYYCNKQAHQRKWFSALIVRLGDYAGRR